jgi:hypothetical protein
MYTNEREGKPEQKFDAPFGTIFRIRNVFKEASSNKKFSFLFNKTG